ncbi:MAG: erythromycin esterase family protein, partial [Bacteroidota bacterium]
DFEKIGAILKDKKIVAIGDSSHGIGAYYDLKSELVMYLHENHGFDVLMMEGGFGDINLAWADVDQLSADELRNHTVFSNFRAKEATPLFDYLKGQSNDKNVLDYAGFDTQMSSQYFKDKLEQILKTIDLSFADSLGIRFQSYSKWYQAAMRNDSIDYIKQRDIFINNAKKASALLKNNKADVMTMLGNDEFQFQIMLKTLEGFEQSIDLLYSERYMGVGKRDEIMAENFNWLLKTFYPDRKVIIWAHNGHVENAGLGNRGYKWMGHFLKEQYQEDYYSLGLFAYKGDSYQHWTKQIIPFENSDSTNVERILLDATYSAAYLDLSSQEENSFNQWIFNEVNGFEIESNGQITFIPKVRFDGIISLKEGNAPTFE